MNPRVPERKVGSPCQLETETASSLAQAKEEEEVPAAVVADETPVVEAVVEETPAAEASAE